MDQVKCQQLFSAIKSDDLVLFSDLIKGNESLSFGRFPILSLCYMFEARKIIKEYNSKLCKVSEYRVTMEYFEIYQTFRKVAGRCLRLYTQGCIVSPLEMLAILHKDRLVKKYFRLFPKNEIIVANLKSIYAINTQKTKVGASTIKIDREPLSGYQKSLYYRAIYIACTFIVVFLVGFLTTGFTFGVGTTLMPFKINSGRQLLQALNSSGNYVLASDVTLDNNRSNIEFNGELDGNGHTIYVNTMLSENILSINDGILKNINIVYTKLQGDINSNLSLLVGQNSGTIDNVKITCDELVLDCQKSVENDIGISAFASTNDGTISNCRLSMSASIEASGQGECTLAGFVGENNGIVRDCVFLEGSNLQTTDVDVAGFVGNNTLNANIYNCKNYATLSQDSITSDWSPNVSGITLVNYGNVENAFNLADINIKSLLDDENAQGNVFIAGISTMNYGTINKCLNKGDLTATSKRLIVYGGGITAYSSYWVDGESMILPKITNSGNDCDINLQTENEKVFIFAGGLSGFLYGEMNNCYSLASFTNGYDETKYFMGTCLGSSYLQYQLFSSLICIIASENYVLDRDNVLYQIGSLINNGSIVSTGLDCTGGEMTTVLSCDAIKEMEVYWDE